MEQADVVIVGGGLAGLSLATRLTENDFASCRRVVVVEPRTAYVRDRTWCFWDTSPHPFDRCADRRWTSWKVVAPGGRTLLRTGRQYRYQHLPADRFYDDALCRARDVDVRPGVAASAVVDEGPRVRVETDAGPLSAELVVDTRPQVPARGPADVTFFQQFVGTTVVVGEGEDASAVTLMDFDVVQPAGTVAFAYVLPRGDGTALAELTLLTPCRHDWHALAGLLGQYVRSKGWRRVEGGYGEQGLLPMATTRFDRHPSPRVVRVGVGGGAGKPSTGYAFLAVQRQVEGLARAIASGAPATSPRPRSRVTRFLDDVFLARLARAPETFPAVFARLFERVPPDRLVRFLSDAATPADRAAVVAAMPKLPFAAEALRAWRTWARGG